MKWNGIEVTEHRWIPSKGIGVIDGVIFHGPGLAWVNTSPPCFLDLAEGCLVDLPATLVPAIVELLSAPKPLFAPRFLAAPDDRVDSLRYLWSSMTTDPGPGIQGGVRQ